MPAWQAEVNMSLQQELARARAEASSARESARLGAGSVQEALERVSQLETALAAAEHRVRECEVIRKKLHNTILVSHVSPSRLEHTRGPSLFQVRKTRSKHQCCGYAPHHQRRWVYGAGLITCT